MFVNTGLEYPEVQNFVRKCNNVTIIRPEKSFKQVIEKCGYPIISKEIAQTILYARRSIELGGQKYKFALDKLNGTSICKSTGKLSMYNCKKWKFLLDAPFKISNECCKFLKKNPAKKYSKETNRKPITATMACESRLRTAQWLQRGCNGFNAKSPISNPMSFWVEQDVLQYITEYKIPYCEIYGEIQKDKKIIQYPEGREIVEKIIINKQKLMATYDKEYLLVKLTPQTIMENIDLLVNELILDKN